MIRIEDNLRISFPVEGMTKEQIEAKIQNIQHRFEVLKTMIHNVLDNYDILNSWKDDVEQRKFLGDRDNRVCRFCGAKEGKKDDDANNIHTFRKEAHALSNLIGNNHLFSYYECDKCNGELFTKMESHFANYMNLYHCVLQVKGKRGVPSYKLKPNAFSRIDATDGIKIKAKVDEESIVDVKEEENTLILHGKRTYIPQMVYKCLLKMALTVMSESEIQYFETALDFLQGKFEYDKNLIVRMNVYRESFPYISYMLFKRKADCKVDVPSYLFLLCYKNIAFQMYLPFSKTDAHLDGKQVDIPIFPLPFDIEHGPFLSKNLDLSSNAKVEKEPYSITLKFEAMEKVDLELPEESK